MPEEVSLIKKDGSNILLNPIKDVIIGMDQSGYNYIIITFYNGLIIEFGKLHLRYDNLDENHHYGIVKMKSTFLNMKPSIFLTRDNHVNEQIAKGLYYHIDDTPEMRYDSFKVYAENEDTLHYGIYGSFMAVGFWKIPSIDQL